MDPENLLVDDTVFVRDDDDSATHDVLSDIFPPIFLPEHRNLSRSFCSSQAAEYGFVFGWERSKKNDSSGVFISCYLLVTCFGGMFLTRTKEKIARARVRMDGRCRHTSVFAFACLHGFLGLVSFGGKKQLSIPTKGTRKILSRKLAEASQRRCCLFIRWWKDGGFGLADFRFGRFDLPEGRTRTVWCSICFFFFFFGVFI